jgi:hypothetical protein
MASTMALACEPKTRSEPTAAGSTTSASSAAGLTGESVIAATARPGARVNGRNKSENIQQNGVDTASLSGTLTEEFYVGGLKMEMMACLLPRGRYLYCPDGSHLAMYDDQETYFAGLIAGLIDFLDGIASR